MSQMDLTKDERDCVDAIDFGCLVFFFIIDLLILGRAIIISSQMPAPVI